MMGDWGVLVRMRIVPTEEIITELRREFTEIADEHDGEYDGWEAELLPK